MKHRLLPSHAATVSTPKSGLTSDAVHSFRSECCEFAFGFDDLRPPTPRTSPTRRSTANPNPDRNNACAWHLQIPARCLASSPARPAEFHTCAHIARLRPSRAKRSGHDRCDLQPVVRRTISWLSLRIPTRNRVCDGTLCPTAGESTPGDLLQHVCKAPTLEENRERCASVRRVVPTVLVEVAADDPAAKVSKSYCLCGE